MRERGYSTLRSNQDEHWLADWQWRKVVTPRRISHCIISIVSALFEQAGLPHAWWWFIVLVIVNMSGIAMLTWLCGEVGVVALTVLTEWRLILRKQQPEGQGRMTSGTQRRSTSKRYRE